MASMQPKLAASKSADVSSGSQITVTGTGFTPKTTLFLAICDTAQPPGKACDTGNFARVTTDAGGGLEATIKPVATFGATDCTATTCALMTNDPANPRDTSNYAQLPITFQPVQAVEASIAPRPVAVIEESGSNTPLIVGLAVALLIVGTILLVRRRRTS